MAQGWIPLIPFKVIMLSRDQDTKNPLVTSIALEMISRNLRRKTAASSLERSEYARRDRDIVWYLLRGAIWRSFTRYWFLYISEFASNLTPGC
jgi:hypothetical protein